MTHQATPLMHTSHVSAATGHFSRMFLQSSHVADLPSTPPAPPPAAPNSQVKSSEPIFSPPFPSSRRTFIIKSCLLSSPIHCLPTFLRPSGLHLLGTQLFINGFPASRFISLPPTSPVCKLLPERSFVKNAPWSGAIPTCNPPTASDNLQGEVQTFTTAKQKPPS